MSHHGFRTPSSEDFGLSSTEPTACCEKLDSGVHEGKADPSVTPGLCGPRPMLSIWSQFPGAQGFRAEKRALGSNGELPGFCSVLLRGHFDAPSPPIPPPGIYSVYMPMHV